MDVIKRLPTWAKLTASAGITFLLFLTWLHWYATPQPTRITLITEPGAKRLVVLVHGLNGKRSFQPAIQLAREALPGSDQLIVEYDARPVSNANPYAIANSIERRIQKVDSKHNYEEIVLVGHSLGGMLLRKSFLWGSGLEDDRGDYGKRGVREWTSKVTRFVSLASINRGWSIDPAPRNMSTDKYLLFSLGVRLARLSHSGQLLLGLQRGAPFIADSRVQWIELCRETLPPRRLPQVIHLLGDQDDIVSRADSMDLRVSQRTLFVTLENTGHSDIASALGGGPSPEDQERRDLVAKALQGSLEKQDIDKLDDQIEDTSITRIVYLMHGIRDFGDWTDELREVMENQASNGSKQLVINQKYGYFPMLPFVLYADRQKNVRLFMDQYTENLARYPSVAKPDYAGHSNGTYILASALHHYKTLKVGNVYFAGSVVPKHYDWKPLLDAHRVIKVVNVVAAGDWVVALLPRFFEQIADWADVQPGDGQLDIGSAGFRGFQAASAADRAVVNVKYASGTHSTGVDAENVCKLNAIADFLVSGDHKSLREVFDNQPSPSNWLSILSNITWFLWLIAASLLAALAYLAFSTNRWFGWAYLALLLAVLTSV